MKGVFTAALFLMIFAACSNEVEIKWPERATRDSVKNPLQTEPEKESIPSDMHIAKDSVILADSSVKPGITP